MLRTRANAPFPRLPRRTSPRIRARLEVPRRQLPDTNTPRRNQVVDCTQLGPSADPDGRQALQRKAPTESAAGRRLPRLRRTALSTGTSDRPTHPGRRRTALTQASTPSRLSRRPPSLWCRSEACHNVPRARQPVLSDSAMFRTSDGTIELMRLTPPSRVSIASPAGRRTSLPASAALPAAGECVGNWLGTTAGKAIPVDQNGWITRTMRL